MKHKDVVVAAMTKEGAAKLSNLRWCLHPAIRLRIELTQGLQHSILFFG